MASVEPLELNNSTDDNKGNKMSDVEPRDVINNCSGAPISSDEKDHHSKTEQDAEGSTIKTSPGKDGNAGNGKTEEQEKDKTNGNSTAEDKSNFSGNSQDNRKMSRPTPQPTKRRPDKDLNHDNWDDEDEPEEKGEFKKATEDDLKERKILTARRKKPAPSASNNPFGGITFGSGITQGTTKTATVVPVFDFSSNAPAVTMTPKFDFSTAFTSKSSADTPSSKKTKIEPSTNPTEVGAPAGSEDVNSATTV